MVCITVGNQTKVYNNYNDPSFLSFLEYMDAMLYVSSGVEPLSYYLINGFLNFNVVFILSLLCPLVVEFQV